ncbi:hypothetical protein GWN26_00050 [Candidatus Saccharibacteria bacterium]|nr:hypothetical protein [Candidatus Saccharibacteria bacterium]NIV03073.1 hypothetical protein [Calditrichia bacterium]NIS37602.1 hypothetical protein [Candidatus Saccharibacteria bacterium]NIV71169.1 hypothetical protein [Calditrichia bacterium]NIV97617.1 hypothetical protein [Candidatus Saccharibacteria bacterium]
MPKKAIKKAAVEPKAPVAKPQPKPGLVYTRPKSLRWSPGGRIFWTAVVVFVLTATIFGGGMYFYQDYFYSKKVSELKELIRQLSENIDVLIPLAGLRSEQEIEEIMACSKLEISEGKDVILQNGSPLDFTQASSNENETWEIIDAIHDNNCELIAWSVLGQNSVDESSVARIYISNSEGTAIDIQDIYEKNIMIYLSAFQGDNIIYTYLSADEASIKWYDDLARPTAILNMRSGKIDEMGEAYDVSPDLNFALIKRDGRDILIDAVDKSEVAVLSQDGSDEAIDYIFSPDSRAVAYLFFTGQENRDFLKEYYDLCPDSPVIGGVRLWNIRNRQLITLDPIEVQGMRLLKWNEDGTLQYSSLSPEVAEDSLVLP